MIEIRKPVQKPIAIIRAATANELFNYEKNKLANVGNNTQKNKIKVTKVNDQRLFIDHINKEARIDLGNLVFKSAATPKGLSADELFFTKCELDETNLI